MMHLSYQGLETQETDTSEPNKRFLLILIVFSFLLSSCGELSDYDSEQVISAMNDSLLTTTESWDVNMTLLENEHRRVLLDGSYAINYQDNERNETRIQGPIYVQIYDSTGSMESEAWSKRAIYHAEDREFELFDSVRVETVKNRQLYSDYLKWTEQSDRIASDRYVTIITPSDSLSGTGFTGKTDLSTYVITDPRGQVIVD